MHGPADIMIVMDPYPYPDYLTLNILQKPEQDIDPGLRNSTNNSTE